MAFYKIVLLSALLFQSGTAVELPTGSGEDIYSLEAKRMILLEKKRQAEANRDSLMREMAEWEWNEASGSESGLNDGLGMGSDPRKPGQELFGLSQRNGAEKHRCVVALDSLKGMLQQLDMALKRNNELIREQIKGKKP